MKIVVLHPPLYPVNHQFFNILGEYVSLVVYSFGNHPNLHPHWTADKYKSPTNTYTLEVVKASAKTKMSAVSYKAQLNPSFLKKVYKEKPDIVLSVAFWFPSLYMAFLKNFFPCKLLILTDAISRTETSNSFVRNFIRKIIAAKTNSFIACSKLTESYLLKEFPKSHVEKSLQTIDVESWFEATHKLPSKKELRDTLELTQDKFILLSIGNFIPLKNLDKLIRLMPKLSNCKLVLIGEGYLKTSFQEKINELQLEDSVSLIGHMNQERLQQYYKAADVFLFPTDRDTFGYVVLEALICGLPVLCSKHSGASSIIEEGRNGFVIDPEENFEYLIHQTLSQLEDMSDYAIHSMKKYTFQNRAEEYVEIFKSVCYDS